MQNKKDARVKIVYLTDTLTVFGGLERVLVDKMNYLAQHYGYEITLLTTSQRDHNIPYSLCELVSTCDLGIQFHHQYRHSGIVRMLDSIRLESKFKRRLRASLKEVNPDIIVCERTEFVRTILKVKGKIPLVFESHSMCKGFLYEDHTFLHKLRLYKDRKSLKDVQHIVALTEGDANDWRIINNNLHVIPNVVHLNISGGYSNCLSKVVIFVGRFTIQKDVYSLVQIWKSVHTRYPDWQLHAYGSGELTDVVERYSKELNIKIYSPVSDIFEKYKNSSLLILTSLYEPFGLVLPEAMSCGLPVVSFNCPYGPSEIIKDGVDGFLIEGRNVEAFADTVCHLIENTELRQSIGKAAMQSSLRYSKERIMPMWKSLFEQIVKGKR